MKYNNLDTSKLKYIVYCRKSSEGEDKQVQSLDTQLRELKEHSEKNNLEIVDTICESGSAHTIGRTGFNKMMGFIRTGKANAILVIRANRISRNPIDAGYVISLMDEKKLLFIKTPNSTCYTTSSTDKMMIALELIFSKKDSDDKGDMVKEGQKTKALKGLPHGVATLGFINDKSEEKGNRKWLIDHTRLESIKTLLKMFLTGNYSAGRVHKYAVDVLKLSTVKRKRQGGKLIQPSRIYTILTDPVYAGFFYYDSQRYTLDEKLPRLITEDEHNKIKNLLSRKNIPKTQTHESVYSGFITDENGKFVGPDVHFQVICDCKNKFAYMQKTHCPKCNIKIEQMQNPKYLEYKRYYSVSKKKNNLPYTTVNEKVVDQKIINLFSNELKIPSTLLEWSKKYIHELKNNEISHKVLLDKRKEERKIEFEDKKYKLRTMLRDDRIDDSDYKSDLSRLETEYKDIFSSTENSTNWFDRMMEIADLSSGIAKVFENGEVKAKRNILSKLGSNLIWNDKELLIINKKSVQTLIDGIKSVKPLIEKFEPKLLLVNKGLNEKTSVLSPVFSTLLCG